MSRRRRRAGECLNPLFEQWLEEWRDEAREEGSKLQYAYTKALSSLKKYPLPLVSGQEAKILDNIGEKLAKKLDKKLAQYHSEQVSPTKRPKPSPTGDDGNNISAKRKKKQAHHSEYVPEYRSGPYGIIIALYQAQEKPSWIGHLTKAQLISQAQLHSDKSFTIPDDGKYYTAWSCMATLIRKGLVEKRSCPAKFRLTEAGEDMAEKLLLASSSLTVTSTPPSTLTPYSSSSSSFPVTASGDKTSAAAVTQKKSSGHIITRSPPPKKTSRGYSRVRVPSAIKRPNKEDVSSDDNMETSDEDSHLPSIHRPHTTARETLHSSLRPSPSSSSLPGSRDASGETVPARGTVSEEPIVLVSDSEGGSSSDVEILPLASRVRAKKEGTICSLDCDRPLQSSPVVSVSDSGRWCVSETPISGASGCRTESVRSLGRRGRGSCETERGRGKKTGECSVVSGTSGVGGGSVTAAAMAGQAALRRLGTASTRGEPRNVGVCRREKKSVKSRGCDIEFPKVTGTASSRRTNPVSPPPPSSHVSPPHSSHVSPPHSSHMSPPHSSHLTLPHSSQVSPPHSLSSRSLPSTTISSPPPLPSSLPTGTRSSITSAGDRSASTAHGGRGHTDTQSQGHSVDLSTPLFQLDPGEFDVVLCVDNAESTASRKSNSQFRGILLQELAKNGVMFNVRKLNVGDFLWIAREKTVPLPGQLTLPQSREAVLEYIIERKRMDDLASSITDGRFREQKFRLKHCGVRHPIYLVEEFRDALHLKFQPRNLEQAISNVEVIDGFCVHRTTDVRESVSYLTLLTRQLQRHYSGRKVQAFCWDTMAELNSPSSHVAQPHRSSNTTHVTEDRVTLAMEFDSFNEASVKSKTLTAYEMFGRHLLQVPCISAERAALILDHFPTITALREAYKNCCSNSEREELISSLRAGNRRLGASIGRLMCGLYWGQ